MTHNREWVVSRLDIKDPTEGRVELEIFCFIILLTHFLKTQSKTNSISTKS